MSILTQGEDMLGERLRGILATRGISKDELADMCSVSSTYFRKMFKKIHGVSPSQYIINLMLEFASHLLSSNLYTVAEVSHKSGFNDTKYFSKLFKRYYGITPTQAKRK